MTSDISEKSITMVWAAITDIEMTDLVIIPVTLNHQNYINDILDSVVSPKIAANPRLTFMHDGAPPHRAGDTIRFLTDNNIQTLDWPANSSDINIIENLWQLLKEEVDDLNHIGQIKQRNSLKSSQQHGIQFEITIHVNYWEDYMHQ